MSDLSSHSVPDSAANHNPIGSPRNFVLACIGLLSLLADEVPALLERSVQRGNAVLERAQRETRQRRAAARETPPLVQELPQEVSGLGLPTHHDFAVLLQQVTELEQQIDRIAADRSAGR
jgi:hypothetical protein